MDLHQLRFALLKVSVLVLAGTTWLFSGFILETRPEESLTVDPLSALVRLPASLPSTLPEKIPGVFAPQAKVVEPVKMETLKLNCWDKLDKSGERKVDARWVRLTGRACGNSGGANENVSVRNMSNGYVGTVFDVSSTLRTTDYIPLEAGKNEIAIRIETEPGVFSETQITLTR